MGFLFLLFAQTIEVYEVKPHFSLQGETPTSDYYINGGSFQGIHKKKGFTVYRRMSTHDLRTSAHEQDLWIPFATIKIVHSEATHAIARLDKFLPIEETGQVFPKAILVGDRIR